MIKKRNPIGKVLTNNLMKKNLITLINNEFFKRLNKLSGQALHAKTLGFTHPTTKKNVIFNSNLPYDFKKILDLLENL